MSTSILRYPPRPSNSSRFMDAMQLISAERIRQKELLRDGKILFNCDSPIVDDHRKLRVVTEELGEVAREIDCLEHARSEVVRNTIRTRLKVELTQLAAVAVAWRETPVLNGGSEREFAQTNQSGLTSAATNKK